MLQHALTVDCHSLERQRPLPDNVHQERAKDQLMITDKATRQELEDIEQKLDSARQVAGAPQATERDKADLKLIEQEIPRRGEQGAPR